ncbi:MAG: GTP-binding protein [Candidatus Micrarchaeota archaeon]
MEKYLSFVIVGHIDHGKSTLIGRMIYDTNSLPEEKIEEVKSTCKMLGRPFEFAYVIDHLHEEREKMMTIDTSQTFFKYNNKPFVIIDAPGHKEFIKNMLTGASQADAAVVIIDTEIGLEEQTKRHIYLLNMLGIKQVIAVFNKMDRINYQKERFETVKQKLQEFFKNFSTTPEEFIPISAMEGDNIVNNSKNMDWYQGPTLLEALSKLKNKPNLEDQELRLPIQDVYNLNNEKTYVGRIESGVLSQEIMLVPSMQKTTIKKIKDNKIKAGQSTGIVLEGITADRGEIVCSIGKEPTIVEKINATIFWMGENPVRKEELLIYKSTTQESECKIESINSKFNSSTLEKLEITPTINGLEAAEVTLKLNKKVAIDSFNKIPPMGRFVLIRDGIVEGGGIIR